MHFTKMQGIGNDYVYVDGTKEHLKHPGEVSRIISDRHFGIGSDGLIIIQPSEKADYEMEMYNADGSRGQMCGNGIRCVAKYVYDHGMVHSKHIAIDTLAGIKYIDVTTGDDGKVTAAKVDMGRPVLTPSEIPADLTRQREFSKDRIIDEAMTLPDGTAFYGTAVSMGNPHNVIFEKEDVRKLDLLRIGPDYENLNVFPERVNTEFVNVLDRTRVRMRVWERGSGETLACGTGACATGVAAVLNGYTDRKLTVHLLGGDLLIDWDEETDHVFMTGPAATVFEGDIEVG